MYDSFVFLFEQIGSFYNALSAVSFPVFGITVSLTQIILGFICISIIISFFWKGARG